jgi:hypothetical protein
MAARPKRDHTGRLLPEARPDGAVGDGLLLRNGDQIERSIFGTTLLPEVEAHIRAFYPRTSPWSELWPAIQAFVIRIVLAIRPPTVQSSRNSMVAVSRFAGWATQEGIDLVEEELFHPLRIEAFTACTWVGTEYFRATVRSRLRAIGREVTRDAPWAPEPTRLRRRELAVPYSALEVDLLRQDIARQFKVTRRAAEVVHYLGLGAGLKSTVLARTTADHIVVVDGTWCVAVEHDGTVRYVPILRPYVAPIRELAKRYSDGPMAHRNGHRMQVGEMLERFVPGPRTPRPSTWRYRSTWLVSHLAIGTRIDLIIEAAGVREQRGIMDLLPYLPPVDSATTLRILAGPEA